MSDGRTQSVTSPQARILIVEDDEGVRRSLGLALGDEGYDVVLTENASRALAAFEAEAPDLMLIDVMLPGQNGLDLCRTIRQTSMVPVIMVTARDDSHDVVAGLEAGADDYVTKPFVFKELTARIRALLRRIRVEDTGESKTMRFGDLEVARDEGRVSKAGENLALTKIEFELLCELASSPKRVFSRDQLLSNVWGYDYFGDGRVVDAHIRRLRKKIEDEPSEPTFVLTVRGLGYKFMPPDG